MPRSCRIPRQVRSSSGSDQDEIIFGTWPIFGKVVLRSMSTSSLVACRLTGAALAFALLQRKLTPLFKMPAKDFWLLALCSMMGVIGNQFLYVKGLSLTTIINTTLYIQPFPYSRSLSAFFLATINCRSDD